MESRENPVFGRKIFFLNPSLKIQNTIVNRLRQEEYEVYTIADYRDGKPVLSENETAICFVNIDGQLTFKQWFNYLKSFQTDFTLKGIILGVISMDAKSVDREQFILKLNLAAGFINLNESGVQIYSNIRKILEINGAKGRRQYVRLDCYGLDYVTAHCIISNRLIDFVLDDISSAGFAAHCSKGFESVLQKGIAYNLTLHIARKDYLIKAVIYLIKENESNNTYVFMFDESTPGTVKEEIRTFVFKVLQEKMNTLLNAQIKDMYDYSIEAKISEQKNIPEDYSVFQEIGDLEEL
jgi:hypothetical protein